MKGPVGAPQVGDDDELLILRLRVDEAGQRRSSQAIADIMREQHGRAFHRSTISRVLKDHAQDRREVAREVLADKLGTTLVADLSVLDEVLALELEVFRAGRPRVDADGVTPQNGVSLSGWVTLGREVREVVTTRLKLAGLDQRPDDELTRLTDEELARELELAERVIREAGASGVDE